MGASLRNLAKLVFALVAVAQLSCIWITADAQSVTVDVRRSSEVEYSAFLAHFSGGLADVTMAHFSVESQNNTNAVCDRVYYLGPALSGNIELVGYSLTNSSAFQGFLQPSEPLEASSALDGTPLPFAIVVCGTAFSPGDKPAFHIRATDGSLNSTHITTPDPHALQADLCHRIAVQITAEHEPEAEQIDNAAAGVVTALASAVSHIVSFEADDSYFSYTPTESILHLCFHRAPFNVEKAIGQLVVSLVFAKVNRFIVSSLVVPAVQPYLGAATTAGPATSTSAPWSDVGFKCPARTHVVGDDPKTSRCVYERCTSPPVLASPIGCYFGTTEVPEAECGGRKRPVPPSQRDCNIRVVGMGINGGAVTEEHKGYFKIYYSEDSDLNLDDFPQITVVIDLDGFETARTLKVESYQSDPEGNQVRTTLPSDQVTYTATSLTIDISGDPTQTFFVLSTLPSETSHFVAILFAPYRVYLRRSNTLLYSSKSAPTSPGLITVNPETDEREMLFRGGKNLGWVPIRDRPKRIQVALQGFNMENVSCSVAGMPSQTTVTQETQSRSAVTLIPQAWSPSIFGGISSTNYLALFDASALMESHEAEIAARCMLSENATVTHAIFGFSTDSLTYAAHHATFTEALPVPDGFVGQLHLKLGAIGPMSVATALAEALMMPGSSAEVKTINVLDAGSSSGSHIAVLRAPPVLSFLLPSADALEAALPVLTEARLVLPDGANATDISRVDLYQAVEQGQWLCGSDGSYNQCDLATANCGDSYSASLHCVQPNGALDAAADPNTAATACAFDETVLPSLPQTDGCGSLSCKLPGTADEIVPCDDTRLCLSLSGCAVDVTITEELISETEALQPICVKGTDIVDMAYCPASLVPAVEHVSTCNATADCGAVCFSEATGKRVNCDDAWSSCPVTCNGGTRTRAARCADVSVPIGDDAAPEVPVALCPNGELGLELSDMCEGDVALCPGPTVNATAADEPGVYTVTWDDAAGKANVETGEALVELIASGAAANDTIVLGIVPVSDFSLNFNAGEQGIPAGVYTAVVTFDGVLRGESAEFDILALCAAECLNGGTCNTATGVCECKGDWSNETCSTSPCVAKGCNANGSTCSVDEDGFAHCECKGDWDGDTCFVSPCESKQCNSASGTCSVNADGFALCECKGDWSGEACSVSPCDSKGCDDEHTSTCTVTPAGFAQCDCKGEWSGETCTQSPCVAKGCNPEGSECIVTEASTARCRCFTDNEGAPLFYGDKCDIPADYCEVQAPPCSNGGTRSGEFHSNGSFVCTDCACKQAWESATDCATCGLNCAHDTTANDDCATCNCPFMGGYSGNLCECRSAYMTFIVRDQDVSLASIGDAYDAIHGPGSDASLTEKLSQLFASELASVTKIRTVQPTASVTTRTSPAGTRYHEIILSVGPLCNGVVPVVDTQMVPTYDAIVALKPFLSAGSHTKNNLVALSALHVPSGFAAHDPNCQLGVRDCPSGWAGNGVFVEADGSLDCEGADAGNPACPDSTTKGGDSGLSTGAIVGIAVGSSIAFILLLLLICWAAGILCFAASRASKGTSEIPMASV